MLIHRDTASEQILTRAKDIEKTVFNDNGGANAAYKAKIRSLFVNLKDKNNPGLRESVVSGDLAIAKFCRMSSQVRCLSPPTGDIASQSDLCSIGDGVGGTQGSGCQDRPRESVQDAWRGGSASRDGRVPVRTLQAGK